MGSYQTATAATVKDAEAWASESAKRCLETYVAMVDRSLDGTYTADQMVKDITTLTVGMQQDAARAFTTWSQLLTGLLK